jgi:hypothetical protein
MVKNAFRECYRCLLTAHEKAAPFLGPLSQKRHVGKESGKAMQGADPANGAAQKEKSVKESEGHSSAASFIDSGKVHFLRQRSGFPNGSRGGKESHCFCYI